MRFVMVDGIGAPEDNPDFQEAMQVLYGIVYTIKFWDKKHDIPDGYAKFGLTPLEGLWWVKDGEQFTTAVSADWRWTVMLRVPDFVTTEFFREIVTELNRRKQTDMYARAYLRSFDEGMSAQLLHIGPYDQEQADIERMHRYIKAAGFQPVGKHHELYLSDPRRTAPEKLKTIVRQPIAERRVP
jgi:hypothetical protein